MEELKILNPDVFTGKDKNGLFKYSREEVESITGAGHFSLFMLYYSAPLDERDSFLECYFEGRYKGQFEDVKNMITITRDV